MLKDFFKNSLIYTLGAILTRGVAILLVPIYTRYITPEEYGVIDLFTIVSVIINVTIALEISQAIARYYPEASTTTLKKQYVSTAFWFTSIVYSVYFIICILFSETLTIWLLDNLEYKYIFMLASFSVVTNGILYFTQSQLKWQLQAKDSVIVGLVNAVIVSVIAIYLLVVIKLELESIFIAQIIGNVVSVIVAIYYAKFSYGFLFCFRKLKQMLVFSSPLVFSSVGIMISMYVDRIAINDLLGLNDLGIYGIAYRFATVAGLVMIGFQSSLTPLVSKHYKEKDTPKNISKIFNIFCLFALSTVAGSILFSQELLVLLTTEVYYSASSLIAILVLATFFSQMYIFTPGIWIAKKTKLMAFITISGGVLNTVLNYILIPIYGISGAAYATLISAMIVFLIFIVVSYRLYPIKYEKVKLLSLFLLVMISSYIVLDLYNELTFFSIIMKVVYFIFILITLSVFLVKRQKLLDIIKFNFIRK